MEGIDPLSPADKVPPITPPAAQGPEKEANLSSFQKFLGPAATKEQVQQFINTWVKDMIADMKKADHKWKEAMKRMREGE